MWDPVLHEEKAPGLCRFPGCSRPRQHSRTGAGRRPAYCDDPAHTATTAFARRRELEQGGGDLVGRPSAPGVRPATAAGWRLHGLVDALGGLLARLEAVAGDARTSLAVAADVEALESELRAAEERAAVAEVEVSRLQAHAEALEELVAVMRQRDELASQLGADIRVGGGEERSGTRAAPAAKTARRRRSPAKKDGRAR